MWALRRSSTNYLNFRASSLHIAAFRACAGLGPVSSHKEDKSNASKLHSFIADRWIISKSCNCRVCNPKQLSVRCRYLSSQAGANSSGEEDVFPALETPEVAETAEIGFVCDDSIYSLTSDSDSEPEPDLSSLDTSLDKTLGSDSETQVAKTAETGLVCDDSIYTLTSDSDSESDLSNIDTGLDKTLGSDLETQVSKTAESDLVHDDSTSVFLSNSDSNSFILDASWEGTLETVLLGDAEQKLEPSALLKLVLEKPGSSIHGALDKYVEGNELSRSEVYQALLILRKRRLFEKALQLSEWLDGKEDFDFTERDYACRLYLIAKALGVGKAEVYWDSIPENFREEEVVYRSLLANYVYQTAVNKAEQLFNKMKDIGFITVLSCNRMLHLYMKINKRKVGDVLSVMLKENIKPSLFTYSLLIDAKGKSGDIQGMEKIIETMKANGVEPNIHIQAAIARYYFWAGFKEKAEITLKGIKDNDLKNARFICPNILPIHASLGNSKEVERIWNINEAKARHSDFLVAMEVFGKLKNVEKAESIFEKMQKRFKNLSTKDYTTLLHIYAENKMLSKGKALLKRMEDTGVTIGPFTWDALVKLYVNAGEVEKADNFLQKAVQQNPKLKPLFSSYMNILHEYARRGDVHNAENFFQKMRMADFVNGEKPYGALLQTYINAKVPAYGIKDRMKADNVYPNRHLATQLALVDACTRNSVSELLE